MPNFFRSIRHKFAAPIIYGIVRMIGATIKIRTVGFEQTQEINQGKLFAGWHGRSFGPALFFRNQGVWVLISLSRDGTIQNGIFSRLGFQTIRGSTGRGGMKAAAESIRVLKKGATMALTPDGPRGPGGVVQGGIILMAKKSGAAMIPVGVSATRFWKAPTWDHYMVPLPFSKVVIYFGNPIFVSSDADDDEQEAARLKLQESIHATQELANRHFKE